MLASLPTSLTPGSPDWPAAVDALARPPRLLHLLGRMPDLSRAVAIVGTRRPDAAAEHFTRTLAGDLVRAGCPIVSGGALGIDAAAHLGALEAGGLTVAVLAGGLARAYPARNRPLFARIAADGALLTEAAEGDTPHRGAFLERNRLIAALARVVIVVQAPFASGALSTAAHACKLGRPLLAVPHAPWQPQGAGCLTLLARGAGVCNGVADVLSLSALEGGERPLPTPPRTSPGRPVKASKYHDLDEDERRVVEALSEGSATADGLCDLSALPAPRVQRAILMLLLSKVIQEVSCGRYARTDCL
ncbi:MAG: DNA-processing protein DprA [Polyangiales bacterium]